MKEETRKTMLVFCSGVLSMAGTVLLYHGLKERLVMYSIFGLIFLTGMVIALTSTVPKLKTATFINK